MTVLPSIGKGNPATAHTLRRVRRYPSTCRFLKKPCIHVEVGGLNSPSRCVEVRASNLTHSNYKVCTKVRRYAFYVTHNVEGSTRGSTQVRRAFHSHKRGQQREGQTERD